MSRSWPQIFGRPNIRGTTQTFASADGSFRLNQTTFSHVLETDSTVNPAVSQITFDPSFVSSLYVNGLTEVRVNALFGLNLIKAF